MFPGWIGPCVGEAVIHPRQARGVRITKITYLDRRWFAGEHRQPVFRRVPGKIDQDIDSICPYHGLQMCVIAIPCVAPYLRERAEASSHCVRAGDVRVTDVLDRFGIALT